MGSLITAWNIPLGIYDWLLVVNASRIIDWSKAGVWYGGVKGIPTFPVGVDLTGLSSYGGYTLDPTGVADSRNAIQAAITACPSNQAVLLDAGTFYIASSLSMKSRCVIRGAGMGITTIRRNGNYAALYTPEPWPYYDVATNITSGYTAGSTSLIVSSATGFAAGTLALVDQTTNSDYADMSDCTYCGRYGDSSDDPLARDQRETILITAVNGNTITLDRGLNWTYSASYTPQLVRACATPVIYSGVEDLTVDCVTDDAAMWRDNIRFEWSAYCWVKNVECINAGRHNIAFMYNSYGGEVRRCYVHDGHAWSSDQGYGVWLYFGATNCLIEDNEFYYLHCPIDLEAAGPGNVMAYNYSLRTHLYVPTWFIANYTLHGAHCFGELWEGNLGGQIMFDYEHGSGSHSMIFRNHLDRQNPGETVTDNIQAVILYEWNHYHSILGNIIGYSGVNGVYQLTDTSDRSSPCLFRINNTVNSGKTLTTLLREGNYDFINNSIVWSAGSKDIPDSLYLSAKPSWWDSSPWPPFTPERTGFNPASINKIPAQTRFEAR